MRQTIDVPDDLYKKLVSYAERHGQTPERVLLDYIGEVVQEHDHLSTPGDRCNPEGDDPIASYIGAFHFGVGDLAENHDSYLAEGYAQDTRDGSESIRRYVGLGESGRS